MSIADHMTAPVPQPRLTYAILLVGGMFGGLLQTALTPVLAVAAEHFGGAARGALTAQMIVTMSGIGVMIGGPLAGFLTRVAGVRGVLLISLGLYALCGISGLFIDHPGVMLAVRLVQGIGSAGISITTSTLIAERFFGAARSHFLGLQTAFLAATGWVALLTAGQIAEAVGWRGPFVLYAIALPVMLLVLLAGRGLDARPDPAAKEFSLLRSIMGMWRTYALLVLLYIAAYMIYLQLPFVLAAENIKSPALQSQILSTGTAVHFFGGLIYGPWVRLTGKRWMLVIILLLMAASDVLVYLAPSTVWIVIACGVAGLAGGNFLVWVIDLMLDRVPAAGRPQAIGFIYTAMYIGDFLNPVIMTPLRLAVGNREAFLVVGLILVGAALRAALLTRRPLAAPAPA